MILLLGFWQAIEPPLVCCRFGGHYVAVAGVCENKQAICISDPFIDMHEGEPPAGSAHGAGVHNDAFFVSGPHGQEHHDKCTVGDPVLSCTPAPLELYGYPDNASYILNFDGLN